MKMQIAKLTSNRIYFNDDEFYRINPDIVYEFSLKKGLELNEEKVKELFEALMVYRAYSFLSKRDYSRKELKLKLLSEFPKSSPFEEVLDVLEEKEYVNDFSFAKNYIINKKFSKKKTYYDLSMKGIKKEVIDEIYSSLDLNEKEDIRKLLTKLDKKDERKKIEYLLRKGYNLQDILAVIKEK